MEKKNSTTYFRQNLCILHGRFFRNEVKWRPADHLGGNVCKVLALHSAHVRQAKFCLRVCHAVFLGVLPFSPHLQIGPSHMS